MLCLSSFLFRVLVGLVLVLVLVALVLILVLVLVGPVLVNITGPRVWNSLSEDVTSAPSLPVF